MTAMPGPASAPDMEVEFDGLVRRTSEVVARRLRRAAAAGVDVESLLQDTYIRVLQHWDEVAVLPMTKQLAWVSTTAGRLLVDEMRKPEQRRRDLTPLGESETPHTTVAADHESRFEARERLRRVCSLIPRLQPREQDVVIMYSLLGHDYDVIAGYLGISRGAVTTAMSRARERLRALESSAFGEEGQW